MWSSWMNSSLYKVFVLQLVFMAANSLNSAIFLYDQKIKKNLFQHMNGY